MPIRYLLDEHHRGLLFRYIQRRNLTGDFPIDVMRVGDTADLPLGTPDIQILRWAQQQDRILVSADMKTLPGHLQSHLASGQHSPGIFLTLPGPTRETYEFLVVAAHASDPSEWRDRFVFIP
jgi:hypothetical protein